MPTEDHRENALLKIHRFLRFRKKKTSNTCIEVNNQGNRELQKRFSPNAFVIIDGKTAFALTATEPNVSKETRHTKEHFPPLMIFARYLKTIKYSLTCDVWELYLN